MKQYLALLRGINVGGNNKVSMAELKACLEELGLEQVKTYINSGNVIFSSDKSAATTTKQIEAALPSKLNLAGPIKVLVVSKKQLADIVAGAPAGFGREPGKYHSDVIFLIGKPAREAMEQLETHPEVDAAWPGDGVVYYRRLSARRTASRMGKVAAKPIYKFLTIRSWNTTTKLLALLQS